MVINRAKLLSVALNMEKLNIAMNVKIIHVKNISILINMTLLLLINVRKQIWKERRT